MNSEYTIHLKKSLNGAWWASTEHPSSPLFGLNGGGATVTYALASLARCIESVESPIKINNNESAAIN